MQNERLTLPPASLQTWTLARRAVVAEVHARNSAPCLAGEFSSTIGQGAEFQGRASRRNDGA